MCILRFSLESLNLVAWSNTLKDWFRQPTLVLSTSCADGHDEHLQAEKAAAFASGRKAWPNDAVETLATTQLDGVVEDILTVDESLVSRPSSMLCESGLATFQTLAIRRNES